MQNEELRKICRQVIDVFPDKVVDYKNGKTSVLGLFTGEVMKKSRGTADPKEIVSVLKQLLDGMD